MRALLAATFASLCAVAQAQAPDAAEQARTAMHEALEAQATLPAAPPTLPDPASEQARQALEQTAFGKKGAAERAANSQAQKHAFESIDRGAAEAQVRQNPQAGTTAATAQAEAQAAAAQRRSTAAKGAEPTRPRPPRR